MIEEFIDKDLGKIRIVRNIRARSVIGRRMPDFVQLTVPVRMSMAQVYQSLEGMKPRLLKLKAKTNFFFSPEIDFKTVSFSLRIENKNVRNYHVSLQNKVLNIVCPNITDFTEDNVQNTIRNSIEQVMRYEAKRIFPSKLDILAKRCGFSYESVAINKSRMRWGSCSSKKRINLSYYCLLLPEYLIDFVMLHELCHTIEMNHGEHFWKLLDQVTDGQAKQLTHELKKSAIVW